jgi:two-component system response regulator
MVLANGTTDLGDLYTQAQRPDLLLLDLHLPKTNGLDVIHSIRTSSELSALPICVFTGSLSETERRELLMLGVEQIIHKPLDLREYFAVVNELLVWWHQRQSREV